MSDDSMNLNVRVRGPLKEHVSRQISDGGFDNASEYVRALIRRDAEAIEQAAFDKLKARLQRAAAAPESDYVEIGAEDVIARNKARLGG